MTIQDIYEIPVYLGKCANVSLEEKALQSRLGISGAVVPKLMKDLFGLGYKLFTDNWYTSEELLRYQQENGTAACGTARRNRLLVPDSFKMSHLPKSEYRFRRNGNILAVTTKRKFISYPPGIP